MGDTMDDGMDDGPAFKWMTYSELAHARGISTASATRLAFRRKWRRQTGNDKIARVAVPDGEEKPRADDKDDITPADTPGAIPDVIRVTNILEVAVSALRDRAEAAEKRADRAEDRANKLQAENVELREQWSSAIATAEAERGRAERAEEMARAGWIWIRLFRRRSGR